MRAVDTVYQRFPTVPTAYQPFPISRASAREHTWTAPVRDGARITKDSNGYQTGPTQLLSHGVHARSGLSRIWDPGIHYSVHVCAPSLHLDGWWAVRPDSSASGTAARPAAGPARPRLARRSGPARSTAPGPPPRTRHRFTSPRIDSAGRADQRRWRLL